MTRGKGLVRLPERVFTRAVFACAALFLSVLLALPAPAGATHHCGGPSASWRVCAPGAPRYAYVEDGTDWRSQNSFRLWWTNPVHPHAIVAARYDLCKLTPYGGCVSNRVPDSGGSIPVSVFDGPGHYRIWVWLEDDQGRHWPANSAEFDLRYDNVAPGRAKPRDRNGWINAREAASYPQVIELERLAVRPVSDIRGYSVTRDGRDPDATIDVASDPGTYQVNNLPEGVTTIKARAISGANVPSAEIGSTQVRVDKTPPTAAVQGAPDPSVWQRAPVDLRLSGADQAHLSGMAPAPAGRPVEEGGYVAYSLNGGPLQKVRGSAASVHVAGDGQYTVTYHATDVAGNESPRRTIAFQVDKTAPETVAFERQDPADPRRMSVVVGDRTSGIAGGTIEMRKAGTDAWQVLPTRLSGNRLVAYVDDEGLERGASYQFRARARDVAGNEATGYTRGDGSAVVMPGTAFRAVTDLSVQRVGHTTQRCKRVRKARRRGARRRSARRRPRRRVCRTVSGNAVPFGRPARVAGRLTVAGQPMAGQALSVLGRPSVPGAAFERLGGAQTGADGGFSFVVPPGPSRVLVLRYEGTTHHRPSAASVEARVQGTTTLSRSRRRLLNGQSVVFRGALLGRPLPPPGADIVDMQAFYRKRWRTFATARVDGAGRWRVRYRFEATRGRVTYRFRARVRAEGLYPYDPGYSRKTSVTVRGR